MRKIIAYEIVKGSRDDLVNGMRLLTETGWEPFGSLTYVDGMFHQVVVKYDNTTLEQLLKLAKALIGLKFGIGGS